MCTPVEGSAADARAVLVHSVVTMRHFVMCCTVVSIKTSEIIARFVIVILAVFSTSSDSS